MAQFSVEIIRLPGSLLGGNQQWMDILAQADVPFAPIHTVSEALEDPQVQALNVALAMQHPQEGEVIGIDCPVRVDGERPRTLMQAPPQLGEHTEEILRELNRNNQG